MIRVAVEIAKLRIDRHKGRDDELHVQLRMVEPAQSLHALVERDRAAVSLEDAFEVLRPVTRADCIDGVRPCPWLACKFNLTVDVSPEGDLRYLADASGPVLSRDNCLLDAVDRSIGAEPAERLSIGGE